MCMYNTQDQQIVECIKVQIQSVKEYIFKKITLNLLNNMEIPVDQFGDRYIYFVPFIVYSLISLTM